MTDMNAQPAPSPIGNSAGKLASEAMVMREKYWEEMDDAQRVQALRDEVFHQARVIAGLQQCIDVLMRHGHKDDLMIVTATDPRNSDKEREYRRSMPTRLATKWERNREHY